MPENEPDERTASGVVGTVIGKAKSVVGSLLGNDELQREGNLQQAQADAEVEAERERRAAEQARHEAEVAAEKVEITAERERLRAEIAAEERESVVERTEAQQEATIAQEARRRETAIEGTKRARERGADALADAADRQHAAEAAEAARLERAANAAEAAADMIDPEVK